MDESIACENLTDEILASYQKQGFTLLFSEEIMRCDLSLPIPQITSLQPVSYMAWNAHTSHDFFGVYQAAFRERPGFPGWSEEAWIRWTADDSSFRPDLSLLAMVQDQPAGFVTNAEEEIAAEHVGFIIQLGVHPNWRGQRVGAALMIHSLHAWQKDGERTVMLHVNNNNPHAIQLYRQLGFVSMGRRGKFRKQ